MEARARFSLAICTYNRAERLVRSFESIERALERCARGTWEVLAIDNNSPDRTAQVCREFTARFPLRYVFEPEQGLSHARNRALAECSGDLLLFTDDDVSVDEDWLVEYGRAAEAFEGAGFLGGRVVPSWRTPRPRWLGDEKMSLISGLLVNYDLGDANRWLEEMDPLPFGASFAIRRRLFEKTGLFREDLGVKGDVTGRGEEADYLQRARQEGFKGAYVGTAVCHHIVDPGRLSLRYLYKYGVQKGIAQTRMGQTRGNGRATKELMYGIRGLAQLAQGRGDRFRQCVINMGIQRGLRREGR